MSYSLMIVEDEEIIREGLANFIDWVSIGFNVIGKMEDGREAQKYLENNPVDVVLTDIKMTFISGLDLAKYVYENELNTKVVIISGYKEFEYARQAVKYNVENYLLKPFDVDSVTPVFKKIKEELDDEQRKRINDQQEMKEYRDLIPLLRDQFFLDLLVGAIKDEEDINRKLKLLKFDLIPSKTMCNIINLYIKDQDSNYKKGREEIYSSICNFIKGKREEIYYIPIRNNIHRVLQIITLCDQYTDQHRFNSSIIEYLDRVTGQVKNMLLVKVEYKMKYKFKCIYDLIGQGSRMNFMESNANKETNTLLPRQYDFLEEQQKLFLSYLNEGDFKAINNLMDSLLEKLVYIDINYAKNFIINLFSMMVNRLKTLDVDLYKITGGNIDYNSLLQMNNMTDISFWSKEIIGHINKEIDNNKKEYQQKKIIVEAKEYIKENYNKDLSLEDIADHVFLSPVYFSRLFKKETGENFIDYLKKVRMKSAIRLLKNPDNKIYEISQQVGYKSSKYFSRLFREYTGLTPSDYRENN